jgi:hypothetical protein
MDTAIMEKLTEMKNIITDDLTQEERAKMLVYLFAYCETILEEANSPRSIVKEETKVFAEKLFALIFKAHKGITS